MSSPALQNAGAHPVALTVLPGQVLLNVVGEGEAAAGLEVSPVATDVGVGLGVSPDQAVLSLLLYEGGQGGPGQFALLVEGVVTQPASLGSGSEGGVTVGGHDVPGLQDLDCNNKQYFCI